MSDMTAISWTDSTWPVVTGCTHISEGCDNCYAAKLTSGRLAHHPAYAGLAENGKFNGTVRLLPERLDWPLHWRKPRRIFVSDMADLFHQDVPDEYIERVFAVMAQASQHTFQILTKRHARLRSFLQDECRCGKGHVPGIHLRSAMDWAGTRHSPTYVAGVNGHEVYHNRPWPLRNVHAGVSAENQKWAEIRWAALRETPVAVCFMSAEPLLGPIDFDLLDGMPDWIIVGGESGPNHRPMDLAWLESIIGQCQDAGVPVWVKQDSGPRAGQQGRIPDDLFIQQFPEPLAAVAS